MTAEEIKEEEDKVINLGNFLKNNCIQNLIKNMQKNK